MKSNGRLRIFAMIGEHQNVQEDGEEIMLTARPRTTSRVACRSSP